MPTPSGTILQTRPFAKLRSDPNLSWPTDILYIPRPDRAGDEESADGNDELVRRRRSDSRAPAAHGLTTDLSGTLTFSAPVALDTATIAFSRIGATYVSAMLLDAHGS
jgi:hypothetical protein